MQDNEKRPAAQEADEISPEDLKAAADMYDALAKAPSDPEEFYNKQLSAIRGYGALGPRRALIVESPDAETKKRYKVTYTYLRPASTGPFTGKAVVTEKRKRGDEIPAPFGMARVNSCREVR